MADERVEINDESSGAGADGVGRDGGRVLIVADEAVAGEELRKSVIDHLEGEPTSVFVVAPALAASGLKHTMGDVDGAIGPARERLERTLEELRKAGIEADGEVGDSDPMVAINDEILKFRPDQILVVAHNRDESAFAERGLLEQMQRDLDLPVTELVVDRGERPHVLDVKETEAGAGRRKGWRPSANMPPLSKRDLGGILVAILGTLLLGALAADCVGEQSGHDFEEGRLNFACAARILIATGLALINLAHVVGLFLFQSVGYEGMWNRFFARLSLIGTPLAIVASLLLGLA
ncbi:MAG TPA: hypothetical protein VEQ41_04695 [Solirubrobacterales bacterium]|nr:hypothetical protein [Solirubrobacterales bacterium]